MSVCCINRANLVFAYLLLLLIISSSIASRPYAIQKSLTKKFKPTEYKRLAKYCLIEDYPAWLQRQHEFNLWFDLARLLRLPIHEDMEFQRQLEHHRLQSECLRFVERLPVSVGPGKK